MNVCYWVNCYINVNIRSIEFCAGKFRAFFYRIGALITKAPPLEEVDSELALKTEEFYSRKYLLFARH